MDQIPHTRKPALAGILLKLLTGPEVVIVIVDIVPVHVKLAVVPVDVRDIAIRVPGTLLPDSINFTEDFLQNLLGLPMTQPDLFRKQSLQEISSPESGKQFHCIGKLLSP
ncbi:MAG TPA: hypothetical protein VJJ72_01320 [Candidatus Paceibacterota bacterium]